MKCKKCKGNFDEKYMRVLDGKLLCFECVRKVVHAPGYFHEKETCNFCGEEVTRYEIVRTAKGSMCDRCYTLAAFRSNTIFFLGKGKPTEIAS